MNILRSPAWYIPIAGVIISSFFACGYAIFAIKYNAPLPWTFPDQSRHALILFFLGVLGATTYSGAFFAKDANRYFRELKNDPTFLDPLGYLLLIVGGGVTGLVLVVAIRAGFAAAYTDTLNGEMRPAASYVLSFVGGITTERVKSFMISIGKKIMKPDSQLQTPHDVADGSKA